MSTPRVFACLGLLAITSLFRSQTSSTAYTVTEALPGPNAGTMTVYRNGNQALIEYNHPAQPDGTPASRSLNLYDLKAGASYSWDPTGSPITCRAGTFSGGWGSPSASTAGLSGSIAKGDLKPAGTETINGIPRSE